MPEPTTPILPLRDYERWLHNRDQRDREEAAGRETSYETSKTAFDASIHAVRFPTRYLDRQIRKSRPTLKQIFTVKKAINIVRCVCVFVAVFDTVNIAVVMFAGQYDFMSNSSGFLRYGMTIPASLCTMVNAVGIFLLSVLIERLFVRTGANGRN